MKKVGSYEILTPLGAGGMGEVYRARETGAGGRDQGAAVGLRGGSGPDGAVPTRSAGAGVEEPGGGLALVRELVEGPTLADRIAGGRIPLDEALGMARQIAMPWSAHTKRASCIATCGKSRCPYRSKRIPEEVGRWKRGTRRRCSRFLVVKSADAGSAVPLTVEVNWLAGKR